MRPSDDPPVTDAAVLDDLARQVQAAVARGDRQAAAEAYEAVVVRLQRRASRLAYWYLRHADEADEVVQETFLKIFERISQYRPELAFEAWFLRSLVNACLDRAKSRQRRSRWMVAATGVEELAGRLASREPSPERQVLDQERESALADAIRQLPERQRAVVLLSQLDQRSHAEIGAMIGLNASTVRVHLFRAMRRLRTLLGAPQARRAAQGATGTRS